ncbi:MAG: addiction module toxin RelE, partial [Pedobacter sp.]
MTNEVIPTPVFIKKAKRLKKKFVTLSDTLLDLEKNLLKNPRLGDPYGKNIYKVRISDESKGKGKSGGFRVVTYVVDESDEGTSIYLITILDKSEDSTIKKAAVLKLL